MNAYFLDILLAFSMIFSLLFLSVKKVNALYNTLYIPYNYSYSINVRVEGDPETSITEAASGKIRCNEYLCTKSNNQYCQYYGGSLYGGIYGGLYSG